jgi:hypothetical protein
MPMIVYSTRTGVPSPAEHARIVRAIHAARQRPAPRMCWTTTPEPHYAGEFPMTCYACHLTVDD